jgi:drug/metabolite transporter (DMT)-like permease
MLRISNCLNNSEGGKRMLRRRVLAYSALLLAVFIWGVSFVIVKEGVKAWEGQKFTFLAARFWLACLVYGIYLTVRNGLSRNTFPLNASMMARASLVGLVLASGYGLQTWYLVEGSAVRAAFLTSTTVLWAPIIALMFCQRVHAATVFGATVAMTGIVLMEWENISLDSGLTHWFALLAAIAFAVELLLVSRYVPKEKNIQWTMVSCLSVALVMTILALLREPWHWPAGQTAQRSFAVIFTGIFATAVALGLQNWSQAQEIKNVKIIDGPRAALIFTLEPVFTTLLVGALILLGLQMRDQSDLTLPAIGCCLILAGTLISELTAANRDQKQDSAE